MARGPSSEAFSLGQYVNDRSYAASSMLAVALGKVFASARRGVSKERPELVATALPLEIHLPALACRGGAEMAERFFGPLGWQVQATAIPLDETRHDRSSLAPRPRTLASNAGGLRRSAASGYGRLHGPDQRTWASMDVPGQPGREFQDRVAAPEQGRRSLKAAPAGVEAQAWTQGHQDGSGSTA